MMTDKMIIMKNWFDQCETLPVENKREFYYGVIRYGLYGEDPDTGNPMMDMAIKQICIQIDRMGESYSAAVAAGKNGGRKKIVDNEAIYNMAIEGKSGKQIGDALGINPKTIYSSDGWKKAKEKENNQGFVF